LVADVCQAFGMSELNRDRIAILRIELEMTEPLIWRRVAVPASINFKVLHNVIQAVMGWLDYHVWEFIVGNEVYTTPHPDNETSERRVRNAAATTLTSGLKRGLSSFEYVYDLGDHWRHKIVVEEIRDAEPGVLYPVFLGGERRCPPEDIGGIPGLEEFLEIVAGSDKEEKREALAWYGAPYDPEDIDEEQINFSLRRITRARRRGRKPKSVS
jgi:hypothetical protein